jgi:hypothetical protein
MKKIILISTISLLFLSNVHSQSYIDFFDGKTIEYDKIEVQQSHLKYTQKNSKTPIEVNKMNVKGYYSESENIYYYQKNGLKEKVIEGKINVYSSLFTEERAGSGPLYNPSGNIMMWGGSNSLTYITWHLEHDLKLKHFFNQKKGSLPKKKKKLNREIFRAAISDDTVSLKEFSLVGAKPKIKNLLAIIKGYNTRHYLQNNEDKVIDELYSKVIILRDGKQSKKNIEFTVNEEKYILENNSKLEISIPSNKSSLICIANSINKSCDLISSSTKFKRYFGLKLNKKDNGFISKVNGNSNYFKTRLEYYEKRAKK